MKYKFLIFTSLLYFFVVNLAHTENKPKSFWEGIRGTISNFRIRATFGETGSPSLPDVYATNFLYGTAGFFDPWGRGTLVTRNGFNGIRPGGGTSSDAFTVAGANDILPEKTIEKEIG